MKKPDRRIPRTEKLLREALIALIAEKDYEAITVQDIVDRANLGRATFYLHYDGINGKEQLLSNVATYLFDDLRTRIGTPTRSDLLTVWHPVRALPFQHALEHRDLYRVILLKSESQRAVISTMRTYLAAYLGISEAELENKRIMRVPVEAVASYLAGAMQALLAWWLRDERTTAYSAADIAEMYYAMTLPALESMT